MLTETAQQYVWAFALFGGMFAGYCLVFHSWRAFVYHTLLTLLIFAFMLLRGIATHTATVSGWIIKGLRYLQYGEETEEPAEVEVERPVRPATRTPAPAKPAPVLTVKRDDGSTAISVTDEKLNEWLSKNPQLKVSNKN